MAPEDDLGRFPATERLEIVDPPARRWWQGWAPLLAGGLALLVAGYLIGVRVGERETDELITSTQTTASSTTTSTVVEASTTTTAAAPNGGAPAVAPGSSSPRRAARPTTTVRRPPAPRPAPPPPVATTARPAERVVGRTSGGGSGNGATTISFEVVGQWRIDHRVQGGEATITVTDQSAGYSVSYTAVGTGSRTFNRTCGCRVTVSSPQGTYTVTVVDTAG